MSTQDIHEVSSEAWAEAARRLEVIKPLAADLRRTRADVRAAGVELGCGVSQAYTLLNRYLLDPRLTSLLNVRTGRKPGRHMISADLEGVVAEAIEEVYLTRAKPTVARLVLEVRLRCSRLRMKAPSRGAIQRRVEERSAFERVTRREGPKAARKRYQPVMGSLEANWPLAIVQIDHTLVDVIVVDSRTRQPIQRPWLTLAIDVNSRCVTGFHLSLEPPSATSVALCLSHSALPKDAWLAERKIDETWPVRGIPECLHLDNGKDFRSEALKRGCEQYGIAIDYRPVRTPHYGGHIERLIGTMMGKVHLLPGTTFSNITEKGDLDPEKTAVMTLDEVERWLAHGIAGAYHRQIHRGIGVPPLTAWERGINGDEQTLGRGEPTAVVDPRRFLIDFLPIERRQVRREGVVLNKIAYWSDVLRTWIGQPEKVLLRYDPRDLSRIYMLGPDGVYYDLSYRDLRRPSISLWEHRLALKRVHSEGQALVDENAIFRTIETMRSIADEAVLRSKMARRQSERRARAPSRESAPQGALAEVDVLEDAPSGVFDASRIFPFEEWG